MINDTLTADEVAKILRVSKQTLYVLCRENKFPHFRSEEHTSELQSH